MIKLLMMAALTLVPLAAPGTPATAAPPAPATTQAGLAPGGAPGGTAGPEALMAPTGWSGLACATGSLRAAEATYAVEEGGVGVATVPGELGCGFAGTPRRTYAVAVFKPGQWTGAVYPTMLNYFALVAPTSLRVSVPIGPGQQIGLCLMPQSRQILSCVRVELTVDGTFQAGPMSSAGLWLPPSMVETWPQPHCATCWNTGD